LEGAGGANEVLTFGRNLDHTILTSLTSLGDLKMSRWQLQEAKARLSELLRSSEAEGPQEITVHGRPAAVVVSKVDYDRLRAKKPSFVEFLRALPLAGLDLGVRRDRSPVRKVDL
jgi:antitoxin Phd